MIFLKSFIFYPASFSGSAAYKSSVVQPRKAASLDITWQGGYTPSFSHLTTVGWDTPKCAARSTCLIPRASRYRLMLFMSFTPFRFLFSGIWIYGRMLNQVGSDLRRGCRNRKGFHIILPYTVDNDFLQSPLPKPQNDFIMKLQRLIQTPTSFLIFYDILVFLIFNITDIFWYVNRNFHIFRYFIATPSNIS